LPQPKSLSKFKIQKLKQVDPASHIDCPSNAKNCRERSQSSQKMKTESLILMLSTHFWYDHSLSEQIFRTLPDNLSPIHPMKQLDRDQLIQLVQQIMTASGCVTDLDALLNQFEANVKRPRASELIFNPPSGKKMTAAEIVDLAMSDSAKS